MKQLKNKVSITLDEDVIERIKQLAESDAAHGEGIQLRGHRRNLGSYRHVDKELNCSYPKFIIAEL